MPSARSLREKRQQPMWCMRLGGSSPELNAYTNLERGKNDYYVLPRGAKSVYYKAWQAPLSGRKGRKGGEMLAFASVHTLHTLMEAHKHAVTEAQRAGLPAPRPGYTITLAVPGRLAADSTAALSLLKDVQHRHQQYALSIKLQAQAKARHELTETGSAGPTAGFRMGDDGRI